MYLALTAEERAQVAEPIDNQLIQLNRRFLELTKGYNIIDVQSMMCGGSALECKLFDSTGLLKTYDGYHLTQSGAKFFGEALKKIVDKNLNE